MDLLHRTSRGRLWATQAVFVAGGLLVYFGVRALTQGDPSIADGNAHQVIAVEKAVGINAEAYFQQTVADSDIWSTVANWIYIWGHWPVIVAVLVWLLVTSPDRFTLYRNALLISGAVGMVIFALFPVTPPRLLDIGLIDTVAEQSTAYRTLQPPSLVNQYAAMPSFHVGWDLLMGVALVVEARPLWLRALGCLLPLAMAWSVVVTANHYLLDGLAGGAIALGSLAIAVHWRRRRTRLTEPISTHDCQRQRPAGLPAHDQVSAVQIGNQRYGDARQRDQATAD
jgi:membrane-associated phospholipid phosphatase